MRNFHPKYTAAAFMLGMLALTSCSDDQAAATANREAEVNAVIDRLNKAYAKGDYEAFIQVVCSADRDRALHSFSPEEMMAQVKGEKAANYGKVSEYALEDIEITGSDTATATVVRENLDVSGDVNDATRMQAQFLLEDGQWRICGAFGD